MHNWIEINLNERGLQVALDLREPTIALTGATLHSIQHPLFSYKCGPIQANLLERVMLLGVINLLSTQGLSSVVLQSFGFEKGSSAIILPEERRPCISSLAWLSIIFPDTQVLIPKSVIFPSSIFFLVRMVEQERWFDVLWWEVYTLVNSWVGEGQCSSSWVDCSGICSDLLRLFKILRLFVMPWGNCCYIMSYFWSQIGE